MTLIRHCGAREVAWGDLEQISIPPATETWFPLSHNQVLGSVVQTLDAAGFGVQSMALAVTPDDARFFGTLQLKAEIPPGVGLAVGGADVNAAFPDGRRQEDGSRGAGLPFRLATECIQRAQHPAIVAVMRNSA